MSRFKLSDQTKWAIKKGVDGLLVGAAIKIDVDGDMLRVRVVDPKGRELGSVDPLRVGPHGSLTITGLEVALSHDFDWR